MGVVASFGRLRQKPPAPFHTVCQQQSGADICEHAPPQRVGRDRLNRGSEIDRPAPRLEAPPGCVIAVRHGA